MAIEALHDDTRAMVRPRGYRRLLLKLACCLVLPLFVLPLDCAAGAFRWVDEHGKTHYSDQVPPEDALYQRSKLNEQGRTVEVVEAAKTAEMVERERQLRRLRSEQQNLLNDLRASDESLMRSFRSEEDLQSALNGKYETIDAVIRVTESNKERQQEALRSQQQRAAEFERNGQKVPQILRESIDTTRRQIESYAERVRNLEADKRELAARFDRDRIRFRTLQQFKNEIALTEAWRPPHREGRENLIVSAVNCEAGPQCDKAWSAAKAFIVEHTSLPLMTETNRIIQTAPPKTDTDVAWLLVRLSGKNEEVIFLDPRCRMSSLGEELCGGETVRALRLQFPTEVAAILRR